MQAAQTLSAPPTIADNIDAAHNAASRIDRLLYNLRDALVGTPPENDCAAEPAQPNLAYSSMVLVDRLNDIGNQLERVLAGVIKPQPIAVEKFAAQQNNPYAAHGGH